MWNDEQKKKAGRRLRKIEGQVAGIRRMIEQDKDCADVLPQVSAARAALARVGQLLLTEHAGECVRDAFEHDDPEAGVRAVDELI